MNELRHLLESLEAGIAGFLSPCVWPLLPAYVALMAAMAFEEQDQSRQPPALWKPAIARAGFFVVGFSVTFALLGTFASGLGSPWSSQIPLIKKGSGLLIMALSLIWVAAGPRLIPGQKGSRFIGTYSGICFLMGAAFSGAWIPCVGPLLGALLSLAEVRETQLRGMAHLFIYSASLGLPLVAISLLVSLTARSTGSASWRQKMAGGFLFGFGLLVLTGKIMLLTRFLPGSFREGVF